MRDMSCSSITRLRRAMLQFWKSRATLLHGMPHQSDRDAYYIMYQRLVKNVEEVQRDRQRV